MVSLKKKNATPTALSAKSASAGKFKGGFLKQGSSHSIEVEADENILPLPRNRSTARAKLEIRFKKDTTSIPANPLPCGSHACPNLRRNQRQRPGRARFYGGSIKGGSLEASLQRQGRGAARTCSTKNCEVSLSGSGKMKLGDARGNTEISVSGSGEIDAPEMQSQDLAECLSLRQSATPM